MLIIVFCSLCCFDIVFCWFLYLLFLIFYQIVCFALFFFFFKQKPAYEMRISDWSSDVCSSDLLKLRLRARISRCSGSTLARYCLASTRTTKVWSRSITSSWKRQCRRSSVCSNWSIWVTSTLRRVALRQIGRASCRERVCQYV